MKKVVLILLTMIITMNAIGLIAWADSKPDVFVKGKYIEVNTKNINGRTMVPLRAISEMLGYRVNYNSKTHTAVVGVHLNNFPDKRDDGVINIMVNNKVITSDVNPFVENGTTYVPVRFIAEALNLRVEWDEENNSVYIGDPESEEYLAKIITHVSDVTDYGHKTYDTPNKIVQVGYSDILHVDERLGTSKYDVSNNNSYSKDKYFKFGDEKITTVDGSYYWGFFEEERFYDYNTKSVSCLGKTYYNNPEGLRILYTDSGFYTYEQLGLGEFSSWPKNYRITDSLKSGGYLLRDDFSRTVITCNEKQIQVHEPMHFNEMVTYTEHNGKLYYFTCAEYTLATKNIYTLYKYDFAKKTTEMVTEFVTGKNHLMFSNGQIFEETDNGFNVYSLSGIHLRSIIIRNISELTVKLDYYDHYQRMMLDVENDRGIHESLKGNIYFIAKASSRDDDRHLIQLTPIQ